MKKGEKKYDVVTVKNSKALEYGSSLLKGIIDGLCSRQDFQLQDIIIEVWNTKTKKNQKISIAKCIQENVKKYER